LPPRGGVKPGHFWGRFFPEVGSEGAGVFAFEAYLAVRRLDPPKGRAGGRRLEFSIDPRDDFRDVPLLGAARLCTIQAGGAAEARTLTTRAARLPESRLSGHCGRTFLASGDQNSTARHTLRREQEVIILSARDSCLALSSRGSRDLRPCLTRRAASRRCHDQVQGGSGSLSVLAALIICLANR
jgi:hypothetical protein